MHYKWKPEIDFDNMPDDENKEYDEQMKNKKIKSLIKYLKTYETRLEFKGNKKRIHKAYN